MNYLFTSESVSEGHPDKIADQISDAILDQYLANDSDAKVACECLITDNHLVIAGEVKTEGTKKKNVVEIAKTVLEKIGYSDEETGFDLKKAKYESLIHEQTPEINKSVIGGGAGDQGLMFGYACKETAVLMPMPIFLANQFMLRLSNLRKSGVIKWLLPDAKSQVTVRYENQKPVGIDNVVISTQHRKEVSQRTIRETIIEELIKPILAKYFPESTPEFHVNPSGSFTIGGPKGDTGLTGRKIIVDTYGGSCPHGGGAFSGKDPSKVDRSGAYAARHVAKHIVASGIADRCTVQLSYAIGKAEPTSLFIDLHQTGKTDERKLTETVMGLFNLTPNGIIEMLKLKRPMYLQTSAYGHFGREQFPWEIINNELIKELQQIIS